MWLVRPVMSSPTRERRSHWQETGNVWVYSLSEQSRKTYDEDDIKFA